MVNHSVSWPLQVEMEAEGRMKDLVGDIMRLLVEIGSLKDGKPALSPLDLDNLEGTLREVKERNRQLREECGQMQLSRRRERERASVNSIVCDLSDERPKEEKLGFKEVKEQRTTEQVTKEKEVGEEEEEWSEDLGNRRKKKGYGGEGEEELLVSRKDEQERMRQKKENLALESIWKKATRYWPELVAKVLPSSEVSDSHVD